MRYSLIIIAAAATLAGCGDTSAPKEGAPGTIAIANPGSDALKAAAPLNQRIGLQHAIRDAGNRCQRVEGLNYQQEYRGLAMWVALCEDGRFWSIFIAPSQDIQVRECAHASRLGLPRCRPVRPPRPDPNAPRQTDVSPERVEAANRNLMNMQ